MKDYTNLNQATQTQTGFDAGLRAYMQKVYTLMSLALAVTGFTAYFAATTPAVASIIFSSPMIYLIMFAPLGLVLLLGFGIHKMSASTAQAVFWGYAVLMGLSLATIFMVYTHTSIAKVFFITAATFGTMSIWGYTTKKDLTGFGHFMIMGLIGIIIASLVNMFLKSSGLEFVVSILGVVIFVGLTAYDTQKIKQIYFAVAGNSDAVAKTAIMGALNLYLDFVNLMLYLLRFLGDRK